MHYIKYVLGPLLAIIFLWLTLRQTDLSAMWASMVTANPFWTLLAFLIVNIAHLLRAHRWRYLLGDKYRRLSLWPLWSAVMLGYGINVVLPRVGEVGRPLYLSRISPVSTAESLATVFVERVLDLFMIPVLMGLSFLAIGEAFVDAFDGPLFRKQLLGFRLDLRGMSALILILCVAGAVSLFVLVRYYTGQPGQWLRSKLPESLAVFLDKTVDGLSLLRSRQAMLLTGLDSIAIWVCYAFAMHVLSLSIDLGGAPANAVRQSIILLTAGTFGVMFPTPGGLGSYGFAVSLALHTLYGVPQPQANAYALLANILLIILPGALASTGIVLLAGFRNHAPFMMKR